MKLPFWPNPSGYRDIELGLSRVYDLLARLDNPHEKLPPTIHIAGTNGKGSTLSFLKAIFEEANYKVHAYTSPHLVSFNERIVLNGKNIDDNFLTDCLQTCKDAALQDPKIPVTFFEGITVAAFLAFSKVKADILLLETGMGGRLDATNVIKENLLSIITPISFDHMDFLGDSLVKIATEKAGIIKKGCPAVIGRQRSAVLRAIEKIADEKNSQTIIFKRDWSCRGTSKNSNKNWIYAEKYQEQIDFPFPSLAGKHQIENASVAITAALAQNSLTINSDHIKRALTKTFWPARLQKITTGKFHKLLPKNFELTLDGSHNLQGASTLREFLELHHDKNRIIIFSMLQDKNCIKFLNEIKSEIDSLFAVEIANENKSRNKNEILKIAQNLKINSQIADNFDDAFTKILAQKSDKNTIILICGSLYLAGNFLEENEKI